MADALTVCAALMLFVGFSFLFWFIRRLGILELEAAMMQEHLERPKPDPQPMVEVKNPFKMTVTSSCTSGFVDVIINCIHPCHITCYWKVKKQCMDQLVYQSNSGDQNEEGSGPNLQLLLEKNCETTVSKDFTDICSGKKLSYNVEELLTGPSPHTDSEDVTQLYDLVVTMELTDETRQTTESPSGIVAMLVGIELKGRNEILKPCVVQQFIQTSNGNLFKLKKLFLEESTNHDQFPTNHDGSPTNHDRSLTGDEQSDNLCIVCQMLPVSRALIPCGHACLCSLCFDKVNTCPMCRQPMTSSFILREEPNLNQNNEYEFSEILKRMNPLEIVRGIYNAS